MTLEQTAALLRLSADVVEGKITDPKEIASALVGVAVTLIPVNELAPFLATEAQKRVDAAVDELEKAKVGG